jgi:hypothetical protein
MWSAMTVSLNQGTTAEILSSNPCTSLSILSIVLCLLDVIFLSVEELFYSIFLLHVAFHIYTGPSETSN